MRKTILFITFLLCAKSVLAKVALDPSVVGVGARALGMGRAYVAVAGAPDSIFLNPATLTDLPQWGATSMYSKLISEVDYLLLGGVKPLEFGTVGAGYLNASIGGLQKATRDPTTGIISFEPGTASYYNSIIYLTYAQKILNELSGGVNLKLFNQGFSTGSSGQGYDLDLGITYKPYEYLTFGLLQRNFLPASLGAKIKWSDGEEESLVTSSRFGLNYQIDPVNLNLDYEFFPTTSKSSLLKLGAEWWITKDFALRIGSDQDPLETNLTAGLSFIVSGFQFDYAYHQYGSLSSNVTHTFSLSYGIFKEKIEKEYIKIENPSDKFITFEDMVTVEGLVMPEVKRLEANGKEVSIDGRGNYYFLQPLELAKNSLLLSAYDPQGKKLDEKKIRILRLKEFKDVPEDHWVRIPISILAMQKVVSGYPDGTFRPEGNITRAEMCTLLMKTKELKNLRTEKPKFKDVPAKHWAAQYIAQAVKEGIVKGYPNGTFKPNGLITRAEGVAIISRFVNLPETRVLETPFPDVPGRFWAAKEILSAREAGLLKYLEGKNFEPNRKLTRAEVVEILSKTEMLKPKVEEMLNFEGGY